MTVSASRVKPICNRVAFIGGESSEMNDATTDSDLYLNAFADTANPMDMTQTDEFASLLASAGDLSIPHAPDIACLLYTSPSPRDIS